MKNFKLKIISLIICLCVAMSALGGCAIVVKDKTEAMQANSIRIGNTVVTKQEVADLWRSFYTNAQYYFYSGYDHDEILKIFYKTLVLRYATIQEAEKLIADGKMKYTQKDEANVWEDVFESFATSVDTREKALLEQQGKKEDELPKRLQDESSESASDVKSYKYEDYSFEGMKDYECKYCDDNRGAELANGYKVGKEIADQTVNQMIDVFESTYLNIYAEELDEDEALEDAYASIAEYKELLADGLENGNKYFKAIAQSELETRQYAYQMMIGSLILSAKAEGKNTDRRTVTFNQIKEAYVSAYETYLQNMYADYIKSLADKADAADRYELATNVYSLNDKAIVARYLQLLGKDIQGYKLEENYIAVLEAKATDSLLMYTYAGENYYFTVQHLLVNFDADTAAALKEIPGSNDSASVEQYNAYKAIRDGYYEELGLASWKEYNNVVYVDDNGYAVYLFVDDSLAEHKVFYGGADDDYVAPEYGEDDETADEDKLTAYYYLNSTSEKVYLKEKEWKTCKRDTVTIQQVFDIFNSNYDAIINALENAETVESALAEIQSLKTTGTINYEISEEFVKAYKAATTAQVKKEVAEKIYSNLFLQHAFVYSSNNDALGNNLSDLVGMILSTRPDNNNASGSTFVADFTNGARTLLSKYLDGTLDTTVLGEANYIISDYGIHIVVINDVYKTTGALTGDTISFEEVFGNEDEATINAKVAEAVEAMKNVFVCEASGQTVYQYIYEKIRDELLSGSSSPLYTKVRNALYQDYEEDKVEYISKMSYDELMDSMS